MFQIQGKNKVGDFESIVLDEKNMSEVVTYAKNNFKEIFSIKNINLTEEKLSNK
ncbi:MAG: hypothetical protein JXN64_08240 [Spirochaetes bacterium]|nr:hypothetical protein [Spirochaetota bacterium]